MENVVNAMSKEDSDAINEWANCLKGQPPSKSSRRTIEKVPPVLRRDEHHAHDFDPMVVSFGPYHHGKKDLQSAEMFKTLALQLYVSEFLHGKNLDDLYIKVLGVIEGARRCYIDGSTDAYSDAEFAGMMILDACFILLLIEWTARPNTKLLLIFEHLGMLGNSQIFRDLFLLENQIPYQMIQVVMNFSRFDTGKWEESLGIFFNACLSGEWSEKKKVKLTPGKEPLHLLEIYRTYMVSISVPKLPDGEIDVKDFITSYGCLTELKAKGIGFTPSRANSITDINFKSYYWYGNVEIPVMTIDEYSKSLFLNFIAYEMCPHNPNDFRVTSYVRFIKSLVDHPDDVKELQRTKILFSTMKRDEVVKMLKEIRAPPGNFLAFAEVQRSIQKHYESKGRTWVAELISKVF